jgi:hypothetical protein
MIAWSEHNIQQNAPSSIQNGNSVAHAVRKETSMVTVSLRRKQTEVHCWYLRTKALRGSGPILLP